MFSKKGSPPVHCSLVTCQTRKDVNTQPRHDTGLASWGVWRLPGRTASVEVRGSPPQSMTCAQTWLWWAWWRPAEPGCLRSHPRTERKPAHRRGVSNVFFYKYGMWMHVYHYPVLLEHSWEFGGFWNSVLSSYTIPLFPQWQMPVCWAQYKPQMQSPLNSGRSHMAHRQLPF